jgi:hypothetical protein
MAAGSGQDNNPRVSRIPLFAEPQFLDKGPVFFQIRPLYILQHPPPLPDQDQQAPLAGLVLFKELAMLRKLVYPPGQQGNLNFRGAGVLFVLAEFGNDRGHIFFV